MADLKQWVMTELSSLLQFSVTEDMANCIIMIESPRDLEDHLRSLLDCSNPSHQKFIKSLISRKQCLSHSHGYKKQELDDYIQSSKVQDKKDRKKNSKQKQDKKNNGEEQDKDKTAKKDKKKFVTMFGNEYQGVLLKGRHFCECQASKHGLVNNCLKCGRIVCEQEGTGPCFFCSNLVYERGVQPPKNCNTNSSDKSLESALELRDRLLEYDKSSEVRTRVIDDESDYFSTNSVWLTKEQKMQLKKKEEELQAIKHSRTNNLILDFTGRRIIDDNFRKLNEENSLIDEVTRMVDKMNVTHVINDNLDPKSTLDIEPVYDPLAVNPKETTGSRWHSSTGRVQDREIMEMSDLGVCLSIHQPWASLLVSGIKQHEGRSWYSAHRGRLWIAAASKPPTPEDIEEAKKFYVARLGDGVKFPSKYPTSCLLGCVNVVDCLAQEVYCELYPERETDSTFVFICEDPISSPILFPIKGKHKIYKLDPKIHQVAVKCIQKLGKN